MGGSGPSRAIKLFYAPAPPTPSVRALNPPSWALVHKTTYAPMIFGPQIGTCLSARCHFTGPKKLSNSRAQPPPTCPSNGYALIQNIMHGAV